MDLWNWTRDPLSVLERGASAGSVFRLRLWKNTIVGYRPAWNKALITDPDTFRGAGDVDEQLDLDPVSEHAVAAAVAEVLPRHDFDLMGWSGEAVRAMLQAADLNVAHDTISRPLASAVWLLGEHSRWQDPAALPRVIEEVLRLHPPVVLETRVVSRDVVLDGIPLKKKTTVGYSPYLTHRDPELWDDPAGFRPDRFDKAPEPWSYLPFGHGSGELTRRLLMTALVPLCERGLTAMRHETGGPLWVIPGLRAHLLFRRSAT